MKRSLFLCALTALASFMAPVVLASPYIEEPGKWVYITGEQLPPVYPTFEDAHKKNNAATVFDDSSRVGEVLEEREGFLLLAEQPTDDMDFESRKKGWVAMDAAVDLETWLLNPGPEMTEEVMSCQNELPRTFTTDLDAAHKNATLIITAYPTLAGGAAIMEARDKPRPNGTSGQSDTPEKAGRVLWTGPKISMLGFPPEPTSPFCTSYAMFWPSIVGDIDGNNTAEIILEMPPSDAVPPAYTILSWAGKEFVTRQENVMFASSEPTPKKLPMLAGDVEMDLAKPLVWLTTFRSIQPDGSMAAILIRSKVENGEISDWESFAAHVRLDAKGVQILSVDWEKPLTGDEQE